MSGSSLKVIGPCGFVWKIQRPGVMEWWSNGVVEKMKAKSFSLITTPQYSSTPILRHPSAVSARKPDWSF
jgi:hypothetical protein